MKYLNNLGLSFLLSIKLYFELLPKRVWQLIRHVFIEPFSAWQRNSFNWQNLSKGKRILLGLSWWWIALIFKLLNLTGIWEVSDILFSLIKPNTRKLTSLEIEEAKKVFGDSLPYSAIRIDENSFFAKSGAKAIGASSLGLVTFRTVNFTRKINCKPGGADTNWLIHELVHVAQMQQLGAQYLIEALYAQHSSGYGYGGIETLKKGYKLSQFNLEQQAEIAKYYYSKALYGDHDKETYENYVLSIQNGSF